jgi:hypothetical protein
MWAIENNSQKEKDKIRAILRLANELYNQSILTKEVYYMIAKIALASEITASVNTKFKIKCDLFCGEKINV